MFDSSIIYMQRGRNFSCRLILFHINNEERKNWGVVDGPHPHAQYKIKDKCFFFFMLSLFTGVKIKVYEIFLL